MIEDSHYQHIANSVALARLPQDEFERHRGEFAIIVRGSVCGFEKTNRDAILAARQLFPDSHFSVSRVEPQPADMGFIVRGDHNR